MTDLCACIQHNSMAYIRVLHADGNMRLDLLLIFDAWHCSAVAVLVRVGSFAVLYEGT